MNNDLRYFRAATHLTVPRSLQSGPGATYVHAKPGDLLAFSADNCRKESRFINGRVRAGDLVPMSSEEYAKSQAPEAPTAKVTTKGKA